MDKKVFDNHVCVWISKGNVFSMYCKCSQYNYHYEDYTHSKTEALFDKHEKTHEDAILR